MANYCRHCGNQLRDNAVFCPKCGKKISNSMFFNGNGSANYLFKQKDLPSAAVSTDGEAVIKKKGISVKEIIPMIAAVLVFMVIAAAAFGNNIFGLSASAETKPTKPVEVSVPTIYEKIEKSFNNQTPEVLVSLTSSTVIDSSRNDSNGELKADYADKISLVNDYFKNELGEEYTIRIDTDEKKLSDTDAQKLFMNLGYNSFKAEKLANQIKNGQIVKGSFIAGNGSEESEIEFEAFTLSEANKTKLISINIDIPDAA